VTPVARATVGGVMAREKSFRKDALERPLPRCPAHDAKEVALVPRVAVLACLKQAVRASAAYGELLLKGNNLRPCESAKTSNGFANPKISVGRGGWLLTYSAFASVVQQ